MVPLVTQATCEAGANAILGVADTADVVTFLSPFQPPGCVDLLV